MSKNTAWLGLNNYMTLLLILSILLKKIKRLCVKKTDILTFALYEYSIPCIIPPTLWRYCSVFFKEPPEQPRFPYAIEQSIICCELNITRDNINKKSTFVRFRFRFIRFYSFFFIGTHLNVCNFPVALNSCPSSIEAILKA